MAGLDVIFMVIPLKSPKNIYQIYPHLYLASEFSSSYCECFWGETDNGILAGHFYFSPRGSLGR